MSAQRGAAARLVWVLGFWAAAAWADAVEVDLSAKAELGKGLPTLEVHIMEPIAGFKVELRRSDGQPFSARGGGNPGVMRRIPLPQPEGAFSYHGELTVNFPDASTAALPLKFDTELWGPLRIELSAADVDLTARRLAFKLNRPAAKAELQVLADTGKTLFDGEVPFKGEPAGTPLSVSWPASEARVMKIAVKAYDRAGYYAGVELFPWQIDIPHEEVTFDTAKADIRPVERPKLDEAHRRIDEAVRKYGQFAEVKLFISGHTDSVGLPEKNRALSLQRARSLGTYFRGKGLRVPVLYEGFGEDAQAISTADETDEPRNRRARYIIAVESPEVNGAPARWRRL